MQKSRKLIFLDRDGVINRDPGGWTEHSYVTRWEYFKFLPNSVKALKKLNDAGYDIVLISNQGGISKGHYSEDKLREINKKMIAELEKKGAKIRKAYYCIHQDSDNCDCRKPKTGLFRQAEKELKIKARGNFFIGDGKMDIEAAASFGLKSILVLSGKSNLIDVRGWEVKPDYIFDNLSEAVNFVIKNDG